jgi:(2Fe-2S) ferredoxin
MPKPEHQVLVCTNTAPETPRARAERRARTLADGLKALVKERGLGARVMVNKTSCLKHCSRGITVAVQPGNVWYAQVAPGDLDEICARHLEDGHPLERLFMPDIPWE